jgi:hypothetical protein
MERRLPIKVIKRSPVCSHRSAPAGRLDAWRAALFPHLHRHFCKKVHRLFEICRQIPQIKPNPLRLLVSLPRRPCLPSLRRRLPSPSPSSIAFRPRSRSRWSWRRHPSPQTRQMGLVAASLPAAAPEEAGGSPPGGCAR